MTIKSNHKDLKTRFDIQDEETKIQFCQDFGLWITVRVREIDISSKLEAMRKHKH